METARLLPKSLPLLLPPSLLLILLFSLPGAAQELQQDYIFHICTSPSNFSLNSTYAANLNLLLPSLSSAAAARNGFYNASTGRGRDRVHGLALCRGDVSSEICRACLDTAGGEVVKRCPMRRAAIIWYDYCLLRYSDVYFFSTVNTSLQISLLNTQNVTNPVRFNESLTSLMGRLVPEAGADARSYFAADSVDVDASQTITGLVQCTRDLSSGDCRSCLETAVAGFSSCCYGKLGGRVITASCLARYETYSFLLRSPPPASAPAPPPSSPPLASALAPPLSSPVPTTPPSGNRKSSAATLSLVVVPIVAAVVLLR